ncbi:MAG: acyltransferase [Lachnospiraceae bacterium]|nr:acyltransferase [Lachnospiraceae bacterium]
MRRTYIDNIRWITVVLVVIYHVIYMFNGVTLYGVIGSFGPSQPQDIYMYIVYPWFMLLLFVISGMSARYELEKRTEKEFIRARTRKLLVPSTIGVVVFGWVLGYYNVSIGGGFDNMGQVPLPVTAMILMASGTGVLWFIQVLWIYSMLLVVVRKFEKDRLYKLCEKVNVPVLLCMMILIYGSAQILNTPMVIVYRFGIYGMGFFIGYFVLSHDAVMDRVEKAWILLSALAVISCIVFVVMYRGQPYPEHVVLDTVVCNVFAWFGTLGVLAFMKKWGNFDTPISRWMCRESWGLYVFHYLFIAMSAWYLKKFAPDLAPVLVYLIVAVSGFAGAFLLYEIMSRIPVLRWCVLGIKKEKKA